MMERSRLALLAVSVLLIAAIIPIELNGHGSTSYGAQVGTPIKTPQDLQNISSNLNGTYYLANDIFFGPGDDLNGGYDVDIVAYFDGSTNLTVTLTFHDPGVSVASGSVGVNSQMGSFVGNTATLNTVMTGDYTLMIGGMLNTGGPQEPFALARYTTFPAGVAGNVLNLTFNSNGNFTPIGTASTPFSGKFDGDSHSIYGLDAAVYNPTLAVSGLFAYASSTATISNVGTVLDRNGEGWSFAASQVLAYSGGIVGVSLGSTITNCHNSIFVSMADNGAGMGCAGGIIGTDSTGTASTPSSTITDNWNGGRVVALTANGTNVAGGGIIGCTRFSSISGCNNSGHVFCVSNAAGTGQDMIYTGGIAGYVNPRVSPFTIDNSFNTGFVTGKSTYRDTRVGGIVGFMEMDGVAATASITIYRCYNSGYLDNQFFLVGGNNGSTQVGGIVGEIASTSKNVRPTPLIQQCYNAGDIYANSQFNIYAGGIVGELDYTSCRIMDCYNTGHITSTGTSAANERATGGMVGTATGSTSNLIMSNCYNIGTLTTTGPSSSSGGMIGLNSATVNNGTTFFSCYSLDTASATLYTNVAGVTIHPDPGTPNPAKNATYVQTSARYNTTQMRPYLVNALAPIPGNSIYFTGTWTGATNGAGTVSGWNFNSIWTITDGTGGGPILNDGYPILQAFVQTVSLDTNPDSPTNMNISIDPNSNYYNQIDPQYAQYQVVGGQVTFWVDSALTPATLGQTPQYQWQVSTDGGSSWTNIPGAVDARFTLSPVIGTDSGNMYHAVVTAPGLSGSVTSDPNTLYVLATVSVLGPAALEVDTGFIGEGEVAVDPDKAVYGEIPQTMVLSTMDGSDLPVNVAVIMGGRKLLNSEFTYDNSTGDVDISILVDGDVVIAAFYEVTFSVTDNITMTIDSTISATGNDVIIIDAGTVAVQYGSDVVITVTPGDPGGDYGYRIAWTVNTVPDSEVSNTLTLTNVTEVTDVSADLTWTAGTYMVNIDATLDGMAWNDGSEPIFTLVFASNGLNTFLNGTALLNGTYSIYANGFDTGQTITVSGAAVNRTLDYFTLTYAVSESGVTMTSASTIALNPAADGAKVITLGTGSAAVLDGNNVTIAVTPGTPSGDYSHTTAWTVTPVPNAATTDSITLTISATTSASAALTWTENTYAVTVSATLDGSSWTVPTFTLVSGSSTFANGTALPNGTYSIYANGFDTGQTITVSGAAVNRTLDYFTLTYAVSESGVTMTSASTIALNPAADGAKVITLGTGSAAVLDGNNVTIAVTPGTPSGDYSHTTAWTVTPVPNAATTDSITLTISATTSASAALTWTENTYAVTVSATLDGSSWTVPTFTLVSGSSTFANGTALPNGTYSIYANGFDTGQTITVSGAAVNRTLDYFTLTYAVSESGVTMTSASTIALNPAADGAKVITLGTGSAAVLDGNNVTIAVTPGTPSGDYSHTTAWTVTPVPNAATTDSITLTISATTSASAALTWTENTYAVTVSATLDGSSWTVPTFTLVSGSSTFANGTALPNGTYSIYANGFDTGQTITVSGAAVNRTLDYFTLTYAVSESGVTMTSASTIALNPAADGAKVITLGTGSAAVLDGNNVTIAVTPGTPSGDYSHTTAWTVTPVPNAATTDSITLTISATTSASAALTWTENTYAVTVSATLDGSSWTVPTFTLVSGSSTFANGTALPNGTYSIYANGVDTSVTVTVNGAPVNKTLVYYSVTAVGSLSVIPNVAIENTTPTFTITSTGNLPTGVSIMMNGTVLSLGTDFTYDDTTGDITMITPVNGSIVITGDLRLTFTFPNGGMGSVTVYDSVGVPFPVYDKYGNPKGTDANADGDYVVVPANDNNVRILATPDSGYVFIAWGSNDPAVDGIINSEWTLTVTDDTQISALFMKLSDTYRLEVDATSGGSVDLTYSFNDGMGIRALSGWVGAGGYGIFNIPNGETVDLTAVPDASAGYAFVFWSGLLSTGSSSVSVSSGGTLTADFRQEIVTYQLTIETGPGGTVTYSYEDPVTHEIVTGTVGDGSVGASETINVPDGATVTLTPNPGIGYKFTRWQGDITGNAPSVTISSAGTVMAVFEQTQTGPKFYFITATADSGSTITPSGKVKVQQGENQTFTFKAKEGYKITEVLIDGLYSLTQTEINNGSYTFTNVMSNHTIQVKSVASGPGENDITLTIDIVQGDGYAEYSVNGGNFIRYTEPVTLQVGDDLVVRAFAADGYKFAKWETPNVETSSVLTFNDLGSSLHLKLYFTTSGPGDIGGHNNFDWRIIVPLIIIALLLLLFFLLWVRSGLFLLVTMGGEATKDAAITFRVDNDDGKTKNGIKPSNSRGKLRIPAKKDSTVTITMAAKDGRIAVGLPLMVSMENRREHREIVLK
ncbi:hypothetical protein Mpt1_c12380 [Candidatus Methanoplasma termitum]|uniref:Bacterial repeat domain-containing protein n=1 Tax=Candidatus Methanoplasma termitum TaxID=1577791 RepID=A0A0A7LD94_9ARCH|nr:hypothetical protein [Candidatus Methanoplasma termitum]AIZ57100.1 hypothetical protein Mpt1_c12380 [Candidatus Methanoplasma termitum]